MNIQRTLLRWITEHPVPWTIEQLVEVLAPLTRKQLLDAGDRLVKLGLIERPASGTYRSFVTQTSLPARELPPPTTRPPSPDEIVWEGFATYKQTCGRCQVVIQLDEPIYQVKHHHPYRDNEMKMYIHRRCLV